MGEGLQRIQKLAFHTDRPVRGVSDPLGFELWILLFPQISQ